MRMGIHIQSTPEALLKQQITKVAFMQKVHTFHMFT